MKEKEKREKTMTSLWIDVELKNFIQEMAEKERRSFASMMNVLLYEAIERRDEAEHDGYGETYRASVTRRKK